MRTNTNQFAKEVPLPSDYGAAELIVAIRRNSLKSVLSSTLLFTIAIVGLYTYLRIFVETIIEDSFPGIGITVVNLPGSKPDPIPPVVKPLPPTDITMPISMAGTGLKEVAGAVVGIEDSKLLNEVKFADFDKMRLANSTSGNGILAQNSVNETPATATIPNMVEITESGIEDNSEIVVPVDKDPYIDMAKLAKCISYPQIAVKANVQGKVIVSVLIDELGNVMKTKIFHTDNSLLNQAAIDAVRKYGQFEAARQQGQAIKYWLTIPIDFRLR